MSSQSAAHATHSEVVARVACRAELASLPRLLALVDSVGARLRLDAPTLHDLQLIAEEACVNVMHHAYPPGQPGPLELEIRCVQARGARRIVLTLRDQGQAFDPLSISPPNTAAPAEARAPGGLGVHLIRQLSDHQHYQHHPRQGNVFTIEKQLAQAIAH